MAPELLFLAHRIPFPPNRGDKMRSFHVLRQAARLGTVHLACFAEDAGEARQLDALREALGPALGECFVQVRPSNRLTAALALGRGRSISAAFFHSPALHAFVGRLLAARPAIRTIYAFSGQMAQFVPATTVRRFVMDFVDVDSAKFADFGATGTGPVAWLHRYEGDRLLAFERAVAHRADVSLFVSEAEAQTFCSRTGMHRGTVGVLENGIDLDFYDPVAKFAPLRPTGQGDMIVFTGQMDYRPNIEAVTAFACEAMPRIRDVAPDAQFAIVGRRPTEPVKRLNRRDGILVTGEVEDVRSWLSAASVVVAPLGIARGVQNKVLEAMAMARPVVASPQAFLGIDALPGRDLLVAGTAEEQATAVLSLLADRPRAERIGRAARQRAEGTYAWQAKLEPLAHMIGFDEGRAAA